MRKIMGTAVLAFSLALGIWLTVFSGNRTGYSECIVEEALFQEIMSERREEPGILEELCFDEQQLLFDSAAGTFYYSIPEGRSEACDPVVSVKGPYEEISVAFLDGRITEEGVKNNQTIAFLAYTDHVYSEYQLKCTALPVMNIVCREEIGEASVPMEVMLYDNRSEAVSKVTASQGVIHIRGNTTKIFPKKSYRLSLTGVSEGGNMRSNHVSLLGMRKDDDWILYPAYNDQEKIRNVFSANLWKYSCGTDNALGIDTGTEYRYLELFLNGAYWGLYALGYPLDEKQLMLDPDSMEEVLYKGVSWYTDGVLSFSEGGSFSGFRIKGAEKEAAANWGPLLAYYCNLYKNRDDNEKLYKGIDIDNAVDIYLFLNLIQGLDHAMGGKNIKNLYLAIRPGEEGPTALYAPWDMDVTWGNGFVNDASKNLTAPYGLAASNHVLMQSGYLNQLIVNGADGIWEKIFEKYQSLRSGKWSEEAVCAMLEEYEKDIYGSGAYLREMERWPEGSYSDADAGLTAFRNYVLERLAQMDLYYAGLEKTRDDGRSGYELQIHFDTFKNPAFYLQVLSSVF